LSPLLTHSATAAGRAIGRPGKSLYAISSKGKARSMPLYMDIHSCEGAHADDVAHAHLKDMELQGQYEVEYKKYWFNPEAGKLFCLVEAPNAEAAQRVHLEAHGLAAEKFIEIDPDLVDGFMGQSPVNEAGAVVIRGDKSEYDYGIRTIMFTDIVGSTEMCSRHGDDAAILMLGTHDQIVRAALGEHKGREVKHTGDGIMASFDEVAAAVDCACAIQQAFDAFNVASKEKLRVRIGLDAGEPVADSNDLFGATVQTAARLCQHAEPDTIVVSGAVSELLSDRRALVPLGPKALKGFVHAVEAFEVNWR
jgi:class 3 adenylate cyclase